VGFRGSPWAGPFESMPLDLSLGQALGAYTRPVKVPVGAAPSNPPVSALALPVAVPLILGAASIRPPIDAPTSGKSELHTRLLVR
jgi:hypothetical protein